MIYKDIVQYGSVVSKLILVPIIFKLNKLIVNEVNFIVLSVSLQFDSLVCLFASDHCMYVRGCAL